MINIAVVGATGVVGRKIIELVCEYNIDAELSLFASSRSAGVVISGMVVEVLDELVDFGRFDYALFSAGSGVSALYAPMFADAGCVVIDNSSNFRMDPSCALLVASVNDVSRSLLSCNIIANPNCSTIQSVIALNKLHERFRLTDVEYTTYQAVSGSGIGGINDLESGVASFYPVVIANNILPQIDDLDSSGYTLEELKMMYETRKILGVSDLNVSATCVRVPVSNCHSVAITATFACDFEYEDALSVLRSSPGVTVLDDRVATLLDADGQDSVFVCRVRKNLGRDNSLQLFCVADNIRIGAASNTVMLCRALIEEGLDV